MYMYILLNIIPIYIQSQEQGSNSCKITSNIIITTEIKPQIISLMPIYP